ncbi:pyridoxal phosphate-dependent aminotransferase [Paenibacillus thiaminolyticus]|uniref:cysteine-S-conjugate beta-lyase n=1 Tax=Paenibacillus thiaminolyticus TaxID=49283 RepID=A0AAP9DTY9_PANTH|nr:MalY/PatB family protein [Paenibacillus thiaminolyticus]MCY9538166.1 pyridoxal phosphate-dependent aminotransferase [Paenibacillus thiaminolyticus]MCY9602144.1 pyridoxal phosphate-dependent aminotransferase [Paenibacillus thiaminolyticus]MCY9605996.1 pyridoxal phosphate-dependent aminotransferase [Paenibacillus thiaminolyticus]MCY9612403.1 pyridoxal phosphate-dependent aminotransferase [Paenibacillus thiaminolyticus]MCY9621192.1 pyridoxal phosphate-dependent aminotransferase [Paenibacillus 
MEMQKFVDMYSVERRNTRCLKWDALEERFGDPNLVAMWVADMEFKAPRAVSEALVERAEHGVFGYSVTPDSYYEAYFNWQQKRHGIHLEKEWIRFSTGVVQELYNLVNIFTEEEDAVIIITPVYYPFHNAIRDTNRKLVRSELINEDGKYRIDFDDFEKQIVENNVKLFILCSPHNPVGRVWSEEELETVLEICKKHHVFVIADEIHQDIMLGKRKFISALNVKNRTFHDNLVVVTAPSKTFNLACLLNAHTIIPDEKIREKYDQAIKTINQTEKSLMGQIAAEAAYTHGEEWVESLLEVIRHNFNYLKNELEKHAPKAIVTDLEGTYLAWIDLRPYVNCEETKEFIQDKCGLAIDFGEWFSDKCKGFVRLNMATDPKLVELGTQRVITELQKLEC